MAAPTIFKGFFGKSLVYSKENDVDRWHNVPVLKSETVAAHNFDVFKKTIVLSKFLQLWGFNNDTLVVCEMAMVHDVEERTKGTGDIPGDLKEKMASVIRQDFEKIALQMACTMIAEDFPPGFSEQLQKRRADYEEQKMLEAQIVKVADCLSALSFLDREINALHNDLVRDEFEKQQRKMLKLSESYPWLKQIWHTIFGCYLTPQYEDEMPKSMREPGWQLMSGPLESDPDCKEVVPKK